MVETQTGNYARRRLSGTVTGRGFESPASNMSARSGQPRLDVYLHHADLYGTLGSSYQDTDRLKRVLIVRGTAGSSKSSGLFGRDCELDVAEYFDDALEKLRERKYDLIVVEEGEFLAFHRAAVAQQSSVILENIGGAVAILDLSGRVLWCNRQLEDLPKDVTEKLKARCLELFASDITEGRAEPGQRRFSLNGQEERYFEATASAVVDGSDRFMQIAVVVRDTTSSRKLQQKIDAIDKAGRELVGLEGEAVEKLDIPHRLALLEEKIIRYTREVLGFDNFCMRLLDKKTNRLELVSSSGLTDQARRMDLFASPEGNGISGYVTSTGRSYICPDARQDRRYVQGIGQAGSSLTVPLSLHDMVVGTFNIESERLGAFTEDDRQFAEIFARYVAIALHILDLLVVERYHVTGQVADSVAGEIARPLNDILTDTTVLMEEYIGRDDLTGRLNAIRANVGAIREVLRQAADGPNGLLDHRQAKPTKDAVLDAKSILVIDDEPIIRQTITDILTGRGAEVETACDGADAVAMIARRRYDVILTDIKMPHKNGYEIFAAAKDADPHVPIIFMTGFGYDPNHSIIRARQEGLAGVLYKPFKVGDLLSLIRDVIRETVGQGKPS